MAGMSKDECSRLSTPNLFIFTVASLQQWRRSSSLIVMNCFIGLKKENPNTVPILIPTASRKGVCYICLNVSNEAIKRKHGFWSRASFWPTYCMKALPGKSRWQHFILPPYPGIISQRATESQSDCVQMTLTPGSVGGGSLFVFYIRDI